MGDAPAIIELVVGDAVIQIAAYGKDQELVLGRFHDPGARDAAHDDAADGSAPILIR